MYWAFSTTMRASVRWPLVLTLSILLAVGFLSPASARDWKPTAKAKALYYSQIVDDRGNGELIFMWWVVPQIFDENHAETKHLLDKNVLIAVAHAHFATDGTVTFDAIDSLHADDTDGTPLELFHESDMPPAVAGAIATFKSVLRGTVGAMGKGMHFFAFKGGTARACAKGRLSAQFAGETYTWDTPFPGCPQA
jgi:hypothetical protein